MAGACLPGCEPLRGRNCAHARRYTKRYIRVHLRSVVWGWIFGTCSASVPHPLAARGLAVAPNAASCRVTMLWQPGFDKTTRGAVQWSFLGVVVSIRFRCFVTFVVPNTKTINFFQAFFGFRLRFLPCFGKDEEEALLSFEKGHKNPSKIPPPRSLGGGGARSSRK